MLSSSYLDIETQESDDYGTIFTIPIDNAKDSSGHGESTLTEIQIQDLFIGQLPDGTYCLFNSNGEGVCFIFGRSMEQFSIDLFLSF